MKPSPSPLTNLKDTCLVEHERQYAKDQRAYEHNRHQRKKAEMLLQRKARKANGWSKTVHDARNPPTMSSVSKKEVLWKEDTDPLDDLRVPEIESWRKLELRALSGEDAAFKREVKLSDLIGVQKPRKSKEDSFEVIPYIRSVIVLDDLTTNDLEVDEAWEDIIGEDESDCFTTSYAEIVSITNKLRSCL